MASTTCPKRLSKKKVIFSPFDPLEPDYYLVHIKELGKDFIVKKSSIKEKQNGKVSLSIAGRGRHGEIITSGKLHDCCCCE